MRCELTTGGRVHNHNELQPNTKMTKFREEYASFTNCSCCFNGFDHSSLPRLWRPSSLPLILVHLIYEVNACWKSDCNQEWRRESGEFPVGVGVHQGSDLSPFVQSDKSSGQTGVAAEMLKASGESGVRWMTDLLNAVIKKETYPKTGAKAGW